MVDQYPDKKVIVCFRGAVNDKRIEFLSQLNEKADYLALVKNTISAFIKLLRLA